VIAGADVIVLGAEAVDAFFPAENPIGQTVRIKNRAFRVIGTLERRGQTMNGSIDGILSIPLTRFQLIYGNRFSLNITVMARQPDKISTCEDEVVSILRKARGVPPQDENDFELFTNRSVQEQFDHIMGVITLGGLFVTSLSLLIGGIGVMNIMLVAVTERTNEIGLRRAVGARRRRILGQFVTEAVILTLIGGVLGLAAGGLLTWVINVFTTLQAHVPGSSVVAALLTAGGIGLVFGIYPAYRASRLDPVEAMRHE